MSKAKIGDVAREAGVSLGTVSNALNHPEKVRPETLEHINAAIDRLGYVPNQGARQLAGGTSRVFGLVLPCLDHAFSLQIANGVQAEARRHGYDLLIASAGNDDILENRYMRYFLGAQMAGVLVLPMADNAWKPPVQTPSIPIVYLGIHGKTPGMYVAADNEAQGRAILEHVHSRGAHRVAVVGNAEFASLSLRVRGICDAARELGVEIELIGRGDWDSASDGFVLGKWFAERYGGMRPDCLIGLTDVLAAGLADGVLAAGKKIPEDVLVAGCDGNPLAWGGSVPLTTIASPGEEIGRRGVQVLVDLMEGKRLDVLHQEMVEPKLLARMSTATTRIARKQAEPVALNLGEYL
ncbi:MAG: LacI family DNA-binding transcriptional regulator [Eggerthellaceae bacterium]|nr:LacI family DNA-binding transcriptional regulator [Eggerthellaceae bacterium]